MIEEAFDRVRVTSLAELRRLQSKKSPTVPPISGKL
jgi:hypothetical protein